jgi:hypothetical protein
MNRPSREKSKAEEIFPRMDASRDAPLLLKRPIRELAASHDCSIRSIENMCKCVSGPEV